MNPKELPELQYYGYHIGLRQDTEKADEQQRKISAAKNRSKKCFVLAGVIKDNTYSFTGFDLSLTPIPERVA